MASQGEIVPWLLCGFVLLGVVIFVTYATVVQLRPTKKRPTRTRNIEGFPYFQGPALSGTAQVMSKTPRNPQTLARDILCQIALKVEVSGHETYDVTLTQPLPRWAATGEGRDNKVVVVEVDSAHPERVRVVGDEEGRWYA